MTRPTTEVWPTGYQGREVLGNAAGAVGRGIAGLARGAAEVAPEAVEAGMLLGAPFGI